MSGWTATEPNGPGNGWRVGPAWLGSDASSDDTRQAAHLIAAAPDLLAACEHVRDTIREFLPTVMSEDLTAIEAAIAKARGK